MLLYTILTALFLLVVGLAAVASNPSPYFGALALVFSSAVGCVILFTHGGTVLSLILFLIYMGGMLVVFAFTAALAAEPYPDSLGAVAITCFAVAYFYMAGMYVFPIAEGMLKGLVTLDDETGRATDNTANGILWFYHKGGAYLILSGWALFMTLLIVLELTRKVTKSLKDKEK
uniref:NADH-ubiquinone oxidoreductase chain 6 n=1 Tax=Aphyocharax rathbuni TaxID=1180188 RepID=A0A7S6VGU9_9TELE|nr:NADH dehydrogenase subunit 6 [Aphyocharax rathbuni]